MKNIFSLLFLATIVLFSACKDDDMDGHDHGDGDTDFEYHAHINGPSTDDKNVGDMITISVNFESHAGEPVHHVNVRIYNKADNTEIYNKPTEAHVHETSGKYEYTDTFELTEANGVNAHTNWVLEAKVWGDGEGKGEVMETVEFHVHPEM